MYKVKVTPMADASFIIIKAYQRRSFLNINYWFAVERILCSSQHAQYMQQRIAEKYNNLAANSYQKFEVAFG